MFGEIDKDTFCFDAGQSNSRKSVIGFLGKSAERFPLGIA
jgi:hypothetical protein